MADETSPIISDDGFIYIDDTPPVRTVGELLESAYDDTVDFVSETSTTIATKTKSVFSSIGSGISSVGNFFSSSLTKLIIIIVLLFVGYLFLKHEISKT